MKYFFALGKHPKLSTTEIKSVLGRNNIDYQLLATSEEMLVIESKTKIKPALINQLGGTIKFGLIKKARHVKKFQNSDLVDIIDYHGDHKFLFGLSVYGKKNFRLSKAGITVKKALKKQSLKVRFVTSKENPLSSVIVAKNDLIKDYGCELIAFSKQDLVYLGKTLSVQDFEKYSKIDYGRPVRDELAGMLPPKVAQIMINLAQADLSSTILDPFCGSGTTLQMAALLGYKNLIGFDKNQKAIINTERNINWLKETFKIKFNERLEAVDVLQLTKELARESIDVIVTEPFLGPPLKGTESDLQLKTNLKELTSLYKNAFSQFREILKSEGKIVIVLPEFIIKKRTYTFELEDIIPKEFQVQDHWQYSRPGQRVIRNIYLIKKA
jgi:tRNA G10  N-methylase Trm11